MSLTHCYIVLPYWPTFRLGAATLSSLLWLVSQFVILSKWFLKQVPLCCAVVSCPFPARVFFHCLVAWPSLTPSSSRSSGSPAELCQLCVDDEVVAVDGVAVAHMSYSQWKDKMTSALQTGSLTMDVRRYGNKGKIISQKRTVVSFTTSWTYFWSFNLYVEHFGL